ncbi:MAG: alpha/beta hydrolase [Elusimicrobiota bacterium]|nr:alpha/beta hydrolase [Elusimicrobiota bacterium]
MRPGMLRLLSGALLFAWALLAVFRAPTLALWIPALIITEMGHLFALAALLVLLPGWRHTRQGRVGAALGLAAAALALTPLARGVRTARSGVEAGLARAFGDAAPRELPGAPARPAPFVWRDLLLGVPRPAVREEALTYARACGDLRLQLYRPNAPTGPSPLVVVIHGGSWRSGDRLELPELSRYLASRGYAVASVDYGLAPDNLFPGPVEDTRDALSFLRGRAAELGLDGGPAVLLGRSAGAQIALAAAHADEPLPGIAGVVVFYGPNDLHLAWAEPGDILESRLLLRLYLGGSPAEQRERYDAASPILRAGAGSPPVLMIHGERDELVWPVHQLRLSAKLAAAGVPHYYLRLPWATHGCDYFQSGVCGQLSTFAVERFLAAVLPRRQAQGARPSSSR